MHAARRRTLTIVIVIGLSLLWAAAAFAVGSVPARAGSGHVLKIESFAYAPAVSVPASSSGTPATM